MSPTIKELNYCVPLSVNSVHDILKAGIFLHSKVLYVSIPLIHPNKIFRNGQVQNERIKETYNECQKLVQSFNRLGYDTDIQYVELGECVITRPTKMTLGN